jgi:ABC-type Na+ efflux pump permease subunit
MIAISLVGLYIVGVILMYGRSKAMLFNRNWKYENLTTYAKVAMYIDISLSVLSLISYTILYFYYERGKKFLRFNRTLTK